jgi:predicted kinase
MVVKKVGIIMVGVSGSGKSTWIANIQKEFPGEKVVTFSLDKCRLAFLMSTPGMISDLDDDTAIYRMAFEYANANQKDFDECVKKTWAEALTADVVIVDNTNLTRKSRARWVQDMRSKDFSIVGVEMQTPLQVVLDRQDTRGDKAVPASVVRDMYMRQQSLLLGSEVDVLHVVNGVTGSAVMF